MQKVCLHQKSFMRLVYSKLVVMHAKPGWVYACCVTGNYHAVKVGFTTSLVPEEYCHDQYSRVLVPLDIVYAFPSANARLAESITHYILQPFCKDPKHEVFDLTGKLHLLDCAKAAVRALDEQVDLPRPEDRLVSYQYWRCSREAALKGAKLINTAEREQQQAESTRLRLETKQQKENERARSKQRKEDEHAQAKQKKAKLAQQDFIAERIKSFLTANVEKGNACNFVVAKDLWHDFESKETMASQTRAHITTYKDFTDVLINLLGPVKLQHHACQDDGSSKKYSSVALGWRRKHDC